MTVAEHQHGPDNMQTQISISKDKNQKFVVELVSIKTLLAEALASYLRSHASFEVLISDSYTHSRLPLIPDVVLLDQRNHTVRDIRSFKSASASCGFPKVMLYCEAEDVGYSMAALAHGADGVIHGDFHLSALPSALKLIASGQVFAPAAVVLGEIPSSKKKRTEHKKLLETNETAILRCLAEGLKTNEISRKLKFSEMNVKMAIRRICLKLNARNRSHAVAKAIWLDLI